VTPQQVVNEYFSRMRHSDFAVAELFAEDAVLIGMGEPICGKDAVAAFYRDSISRAAPSPDPLLVFSDGPNVAAEIRITIADGTELHVLDIFEVRDGLIHSLKYFLNAASLSAVPRFLEGR
jgi:hypothetical protein